MPVACSPAGEDPHPATCQRPSPRHLHPHPPAAHTLQALQVHMRGLEAQLLTPGAEDRGRQGSLGIGTPGPQPPFRTAEEPPGKPGLQGLHRGAEGNLMGGPGSMGTPQGIIPPPHPHPGAVTSGRKHDPCLPRGCAQQFRNHCGFGPASP